MENEVFSFQEFGFHGVEAKFSCSDKMVESMEEENGGKQFNFNGEEDWCPDFGFYKEDSSEEGFLLFKYQQQEDSGSLDDQHFDIVSPPLQTCLEEIQKLGEFTTLIPQVVPRKEKRQPFSLASLELLNNFGNGFKRLHGDSKIEPSNDMPCAKVEEGRKLSTEEVMRLAGANFIQSSSSQTADVSMLSHPFDSSFYGLSNEETKDVALVEFLFSSAEKVGCQQFDRASRLLSQCDDWCSNTGNPVQRVVYYFSKALREKIDRETGRITSKDLGKRLCFDVDEAMMNSDHAILASHEGIPFSQISQFSGIQAIVESMAEARKIHIVDLAIRNGMQWTVLMQALATRYECPLELLKITAVGTTSKHIIERTGKRLASFAETMNIAFSFKVVMVSDMLDLKEHLFGVEADERVAFYSEYFLRSMILEPKRLESIMGVVRSINPCIMVVTEVEANHNSPAFVNRFIEALFFFSAYFDCLETFMKRNDPNRMIIESLFFGEGIRSIVAEEGEGRKIRHVKIDVWRAFFAWFGMVDTELSMSSLDQARLVIKKFDCEKSCTLDMNGKCLIIGWKGTPIHSLSVWKFL
ncbi:DELLA protein RGL1-like [Corylus avellana]|uniref:DELLA protein RGL1-like n=1 Tax=Corylus avellana TaxID=13451 RepID=UPI001E1F2D97|nr:DELLA protein RGL1-like [Corylus avellana]